jgi:hypothetical protein
MKFNTNDFITFEKNNKIFHGFILNLFRKPNIISPKENIIVANVIVKELNGEILTLYFYSTNFNEYNVQISTEEIFFENFTSYKSFDESIIKKE